MCVFTQRTSNLISSGSEPSGKLLVVADRQVSTPATSGAKPYASGTYNRLLNKFSDIVQIIDSKGRFVRLAGRRSEQG